MARSSTIACNVLQVASLLLLAFLLSSAAATSTHPVSTGANPYKTEFVGEAGDIAIGGYDTVAYFEDGRAIEGKEQFELVYKNARWRFSSAENLEAFVEDPDSYLPQYGGFCTVCMVEQEGLFDANPKMWTIVDGKLYLNYDVRTRSRFRVNRDTYIPWADRVWAKLTESEAIQEETTEEPLRQAATQQQPTPTGVTPSMRTASAPYKVAIFPLDSSRRWFAGDTIESEISDKITSYLQSHDSLEGTYSYYALPSGTSAVKRGQVWLRGPTSGDPNLKTITETGNSLGVQAVTLAFYRPKRHGGAGGTDLENSNIQLYVIDVELEKTYRVDGTGGDIQAMLGQVFSEFLVGREMPAYKLATFPVTYPPRHSWGNVDDVAREIGSRADALVQQSKKFRLHYSYYADGADKTVFRDSPTWVRGPRPIPNEANIYALAREMGVDGVVTAKFKGGLQDASFFTTEAVDVKVYVFDVQLGKSYEEEGYGKDLQSMLDRALASFLSGRQTATYNIAIFPPHTNRQGYTLAGPTEREVMKQLRSSLQSDVSLQTTYDYAAAPSGAPAIRGDQVWTRSTEPKSESVLKLAEQLGVQGVVTAFYRPADTGREGNWERGGASIFVFDVTQGTVYKHTGLAGEVEDLTRQAFSDFIAGHAGASAE